MVGFVPTVGLLHLGNHLTQCKASVIMDDMNAECEVVEASTRVPDVIASVNS